MDNISILEAMGLNPKPISTIVIALFVLFAILSIGFSIEGLAKGFKHPSVQQGRDIGNCILILIIALILLAMPLFPATR